MDWVPELECGGTWHLRILIRFEIFSRCRVKAMSPKGHLSRKVFLSHYSGEVPCSVNLDAAGRYSGQFVQSDTDVPQG